MKKDPIRIGAYANVSSTIVFALINLLVVRNLVGHDGANALFTYTMAQYVVQILTIIVYYGIFIEKSDSMKSFSTYPLAFVAISLGFVWPALSIGLFLFLRLGLLKYSRQTTGKNLLGFFLLGMAALVMFWREQPILCFIIAGVVNYCVFCAFRQTNVVIPCTWSLNGQIVKNVCKRAMLDFSVLLPPILMNYVTKKELPVADYICFQKCMTALAVSGPITTYIERKVFDAHLNYVTKKMSRLWMIAISLCTVCCSLILAAWLCVPSQFAINLVSCSAFSILFAAQMTQARFNVSPQELSHLAILWLMSFPLFVWLLLTVFPPSVSSFLWFTALFTLFQVSTIEFITCKKTK